jgi:hypothetical protein
VLKVGTDVLKVGTDVLKVGTDVFKVGTDVLKVGTDVFKVGTDVFMAREQRARRSRDNSCSPQPLSSFADNARARLYMSCVRLD